MNEFFAKDAKELRDWLQTNHHISKGCWLVFYKGEKRTMTWEDIVDELLCFGWIDSTAGKVGDDKSKIWISPRKPKSSWSAKNKGKVKKLIAEKRMNEAGLKAIKIAKENGSWSILDEIENLTTPPDLEKALAENEKAKTNFDAFPRSVKKAQLWWILSAKRPETREKRIQEIVEKASHNKRAFFE